MCDRMCTYIRIMLMHHNTYIKCIAAAYTIGWCVSIMITIIVPCIGQNLCLYLFTSIWPHQHTFLLMNNYCFNPFAIYQIIWNHPNITHPMPNVHLCCVNVCIRFGIYTCLICSTNELDLHVGYVLCKICLAYLNSTHYIWHVECILN